MRRCKIPVLRTLVFSFLHGACLYFCEAAIQFGTSYASHENFLGIDQTRQDEEIGQAPVDPPTGLCVKNTGKSCKSWHDADIVEHVSQCAGGRYDPLAGLTANAGGAPSELISQCSANADLGMTTGTCMCSPGYCADLDMKCHSGTYLLVSDEFVISVQAWGEDQHLFMTSDGKVKIGTPADPRAAKWRIAVTKNNIKMLYCDLYPLSILTEYESCEKVVDSYGLTYDKCDIIVGHAPDPRADEMGWYIEVDLKVIHLGHGRHNPYVNIRSAHTGNLFYVDPQTMSGRACDPTARNCPGTVGDFHFHPPLFGRVDIMLDNAPGTLPPALAMYGGTVVMALILTCCLGCVYTNNRFLKTFLRPFAKAFGCGGLYRGADI